MHYDRLVLRVGKRVRSKTVIVTRCTCLNLTYFRKDRITQISNTITAYLNRAVAEVMLLGEGFMK